jgi:predicted phosphodiesterase
MKRVVSLLLVVATALAQGASTTFAIFGDRTNSAKQGAFDAAIELANKRKVKFAVCVGDLIEGYTTAPKAKDMWTEFDGILSKLRAPFYTARSNHDSSNPDQAKLWVSRYGNPNRAVVKQVGRSKALFLFVDSEDYVKYKDQTRYMSLSQASWIKSQLRNSGQYEWVFLIMHQPLWVGYKGNWPMVEPFIDKPKYTVIAGHTHVRAQQKRNGIDYLIVGPSGSRGGINEVTFVTLEPGRAPKFEFVPVP